MWTKDQERAIYESGTNIIVSAGAGSGKTAVLSERVLKKIENGTNINELLILTFTKAAAGEMKERIRKKISKNENLKEQLDRIDSAYITTFDSYALSIVKKYHYLLNISHNISIIDEGIIKMEKIRFLEDIFENMYKNENKEFLEFIDTFCVKDDKEIFNAILEISDKVDMIKDKKQYLEQYLITYYDEKYINKNINNYVELIKSSIKDIEKLLDDIQNYITSEQYEKLNNATLNLINSENYEDIKNNINIKLPILRGLDETAKEIKENISDKIKEIKNLCSYENITEIKESIQSTYNTSKIIIDLLLSLNKKVEEYKKKYDVYEFNDIALMAINLLKENEEARTEVRDGFKEILLDEYQDTNDLQEEFISLISNNNVYMVGDIKQSIYRFRNANPYIFKNKYDNYSKGKGGIKIDLNKNFRSREQVINNINTIFNKIMDDEIGGADYITSHQMIFGNTAYNEKGTTGENYNFEIYNYPYNSKETKYTKDEIEAFMICNDIKNKVHNKYKIYDKDLGEIRELKYSDIVILLDRSSNFDLFKKIFTYNNVPLMVYKDEKMINDEDIIVLKNTLSFIVKINNHQYDKEFSYLYTSISRSFLYKTPDDVIYNTIQNREINNTPLYKICANISREIKTKSLAYILNKVVNDFDYYNKIITIGNTESRLAKLDKLFDIVASMSSINYNIEDFIEYLNNLINYGYDITYGGSVEGGDAVKIMTIHKSKGLEYHLCYYANLYKKFNIGDMKERFIYDRKYGFVTPYFNEGISDTIYKTLLKKDYILEEISEKIRLFYVAVTRAKEKMIILNPEEKANKTSRKNWRSFKNIIDYLNDDLQEYQTNINLDTINISSDYDKLKQINYKDTLELIDDTISVNEINPKYEIVEEKHYSKQKEEIFTPEEIKAIQYGKDIHYQFETSNFYDKENQPQSIKNFLSNPLFNNIKEGNIYKEYEFIYEEESTINHGIIDLMIVYDNYIDIIDYKLNNIDDLAYDKQLQGYKKFISSKFAKKVNTYLYSIMSNKFRKVD